MFTEFTCVHGVHMDENYSCPGISNSDKCPEVQQLGPEGDARKVGRKGGGQKQEDGESYPENSTVRGKPQDC